MILLQFWVDDPPKIDGSHTQLAHILLDKCVIIGTLSWAKKGTGIFYQLPRGELFIKITML